MSRHSLLLTLSIACCALWSWPALAQQETATIAGTVRDASGAVVPGASVTVTNIQTNISARAQAGSDGGYVIPSLRPGDYSVTAESAGFQKTVRTGITLQVAQVARVDVALQAGQLSEAVEVVGETPLLDTLTSSRGSIIDQKKIVDLPLNGRDYNQLALLSPGVLPGTPRLASVNFKGVLNVNGNRTFNNVFLLDGVDNIWYLPLSLAGRRYFQFRTELFNAFNHANFGPPNIARDSSGFGQILTAGNARIIQFGLKFYF